MIEFITKIDFAVLEFIRNTLNSSFMDYIMPIITDFGSGGLLWIAVGVIMLCTEKYRRCGASVLIGLLLCLVLGNIILKPLIGRMRPCWINDSIDMLVRIPRDYSFPSGHTLAVFTTAFIIFGYSKKIGIPLVVLACLIGFSRMYLYVHYPTDVLGGIALAALIAWAVRKLVNGTVFSRMFRRFED